MIKRKKHQCTQFPVRVSEEIKVKLPVTSSVVILFGQLFGIQHDLANQRGSYAIPEKSKNLKNWQDRADWAKVLNDGLRKCVNELRTVCGINYLEADKIVRPLQAACWLITGQGRGFDPFADEKKTGKVLREATESWARLIDLLRDLPVKIVDGELPTEIEERLEETECPPQQFRLIRKMWQRKKLSLDAKKDGKILKEVFNKISPTYNQLTTAVSRANKALSKIGIPRKLAVDDRKVIWIEG